jgi:formylglycine-generating enzyme required for sulfatase activity
MTKFFQALSEKTGKTVRLPTGAEWEYALRCGTSNPGFHEKFNDQKMADKSNKVLPAVKLKKPNAWGFYDMISGWWEITGDRQMYPPHSHETDPHYKIGPNGMRMLLGVAGENWTVTLREFEAYGGYTSRKFRVAVEVEAAATKPQ